MKELVVKEEGIKKQLEELRDWYMIMLGAFAVGTTTSVICLITGFVPDFWFFIMLCGLSLSVMLVTRRKYRQLKTKVVNNDNLATM